MTRVLAVPITLVLLSACDMGGGIVTNPSAYPTSFTVEVNVIEGRYQVDRTSWIQIADVRVETISGPQVGIVASPGTGAQGNYYLRDLKYGNYRVRLTKAGYQSYEADLNVTGAQTHTFFMNPPPHTLKGAAVGKPLGTRVEIVTGPNAGRSTVVVATGDFVYYQFDELLSSPPFELRHGTVTQTFNGYRGLWNSSTPAGGLVHHSWLDLK